MTKNINKFEDKLRKEAIRYISQISYNKKARESIGISLGRDLFGEDYYKGKKVGQLPPPSDRKKNFAKIFYKYFEILQSLDNMEITAIFINRFPNYKSNIGKKISNAVYLRYHIENYLNELYIFQMRLENLLNHIINKLKPKKLSKKINIIKQLKKDITKIFESIKSIRGLHIHNKRFTDKDLKHLELLESYINWDDKGELASILRAYKSIEYYQIRKKWRQTIANNNKALKKLLNHISHTIDPIVFKNLLPPSSAVHLAN